MFVDDDDDKKIMKSVVADIEKEIVCMSDDSIEALSSNKPSYWKNGLEKEEEPK